MMKHACFTAAVLALLGVVPGCGSGVETGKVTLASGANCPATVPAGEIGLTLGVLSDDGFTPLQDGDPLVIIDGRQGGTWTMPAIQLHGTSPGGTVTGGLTLASGEEVGDLPPTSVHASPVAGGALQIDYVPIPVGDSADGSLPEGIDGSPATVSLSFTGECGEAGSLELAVVLEYQPSG